MTITNDTHCDLDQTMREEGDRIREAIRLTVEDVHSGQYTLFEALTRANARLTPQTPDIYIHCEYSGEFAIGLAIALVDVPMSASAIEEVWGFEGDGDLASLQLAHRVKRLTFEDAPDIRRIVIGVCTHCRQPVSFDDADPDVQQHIDAARAQDTPHIHITVRRCPLCKTKRANIAFKKADI